MFLQAPCELTDSCYTPRDPTGEWWLDLDTPTVLASSGFDARVLLVVVVVAFIVICTGVLLWQRSRR